MIKIHTKRFGFMEFTEDSVITVIGGLIGLAGHERFVLIRHEEKTPFYWLQCVDNPDLAMVMINPHLFKPDYDPPIPLSVHQELDVQKPSDLSVFVIVAIPHGNPRGMTANLLGPVVLNPQSRKARQLILDERIYSHRYRVLGHENEEPANEKNAK